jgi:hypothetical protein
MITVNEAARIVNEVTAQQLLFLQRKLTQNKDRLDIDVQCEYPEVLNFYDYLKMYKRFGIARRVVRIYPDECWSVDPLVYETEDPSNTPFEQGWLDLATSAMDGEDDRNPLYYLHRADVRSGIGRFGAILIGFSDEEDFSKPVAGIKEDGTPEDTTPTDMKLLYLRDLDESEIEVSTREKRNNRRYGKPNTYKIKMLADDMEGPSGGEDLENQEVHWTRVLHLADGGELYADPRMECVYNDLKDVKKTLGAAAAMFVNGGFPGVSIEVDPKAMELGMEINDDSIDDEMYRYMNGFQRYLKLVGMNAKSLAPQVADPTGHITTRLNAIAMSIGSPLRIFMGSEQAQLASGQDVRTWNRRLTRRNMRYLSPRVLRPFILRLIMAGVLPKPSRNFQIWWPDVNMPDESERCQNADRLAAAMMKYVMSKAYQIMQPSDFFRRILKMEEMEVTAIMEKLKQAKEVDFIEDATGAPKGPADSLGGSPAQ